MIPPMCPNSTCCPPRFYRHAGPDRREFSQGRRDGSLCLETACGPQPRLDAVGVVEPFLRRRVVSQVRVPERRRCEANLLLKRRITLPSIGQPAGEDHVIAVREDEQIRRGG